MTWPMCGAPTGQECSACAECGRTCYHDERDSRRYTYAELDAAGALWPGSSCGASR